MSDKPWTPRKRSNAVSILGTVHELNDDVNRLKSALAMIIAVYDEWLTDDSQTASLSSVRQIAAQALGDEE